MKIRSAQAAKHILRWSCDSPQRLLDRVAAAVALAAVLGASPALAQDDDPGPGSSETDTATQMPEPPAPTEADGQSYPISALVLQYVRDNPQHPSVEEVIQIEVPLLQTAQGFVAPRAAVPWVRFRLAQIADRPVEPYYASAIQRIL